MLARTGPGAATMGTVMVKGRSTLTFFNFFRASLALRDPSCSFTPGGGDRWEWSVSPDRTPEQKHNPLFLSLALCFVPQSGQSAQLTVCGGDEC